MTNHCSPDISADITMQDVRLVCGEGKLENRHVLNAVNVIIKRRAEMAGAGVAQTMPDFRAEAQFLLDRLDEFDPGEDDAEREYHGHVTPAIARFRHALSPPRQVSSLTLGIETSAASWPPTSVSSTHRGEAE